MFVITVHDIKYPADSSADLPSTLTFCMEEEVTKEYLDTELANHVEDTVGVLPDSLWYEWKFVKDFQE